MSGFIKATKFYSGEEIYVNVDNICGVMPCFSDKNTTIIDLVGERDNYYRVKEPVETIMDRIMAFVK